MNPQDLFERGVVALQEAALGKARWLEAALLINEISGTGGNALTFADGPESPPDERVVILTPVGHRWQARSQTLATAVAPWAEDTPC